eukprot:TRINITY_DN1066_c0_g1_i1.p2 TRINITY_DN1066_c0_g1~~TRINITY_DN1066_c0_g1_i1.p2  ORF type:complete len:606 (+),score=67.49 TRINITY_DN1066_c0_g1_i1:4770-6587(+)
MMASFLKIVGRVHYEDMAETNKPMANLITFVFAVVFFFILLNMLIAIVMSNYATLRKKTQLKTEANARIAEEEGKAWTTKFLRLIFFTPPGAKDKKDSDVESINYEQNRVDAAIAKNNEKKTDQNKMTLWSIFCINLNSLCNFQPETHEKIKQRQKKTMETLRQEQFIARMEEKRMHQVEIINLIFKATVYIVFVILATAMVLMQINVNSFFLANDSMTVLFADMENSQDVHAVTKLEEIPGYITAIYKALYENRKKGALSNNMAVFSNPFLRITLNRNQLLPNDFERTKDVFPFYTLEGRSKTKPLKEDYVYPLNYTDPLSANKMYRYYPPGDERTYNKEGGVVMYPPYDPVSAYQVFSDLIQAIDLDLSRIALEILTYSPNTGGFIWSTVIIDYEPTGVASSKIANTGFKINQYSTPGMKARGILEVLFCLFVLYFTYWELHIWTMTWLKVREEDHKDCPKADPEDTTFNRVLVFLYTNPKKVSHENACTLFFILLLGICKLAYHVTKQVTVASFKYLFKDLFHVINITSIVLCYFLIYNWQSFIYIMKMQDSDNFDEAQIGFCQHQFSYSQCLFRFDLIGEHIPSLHTSSCSVCNALVLLVN